MLTTRETCIRRFVQNIYIEIQGKKSQKMIYEERNVIWVSYIEYEKGVLIDKQLSFSASFIISVATNLMRVKCNYCLRFLSTSAMVLSFLWLSKNLIRITYLNKKIFKVQVYRKVSLKKIQCDNKCIYPSSDNFREKFFPIFF